MVFSFLTQFSLTQFDKCMLLGPAILGPAKFSKYADGARAPYVDACMHGRFILRSQNTIEFKKI